MIDVVEILVHWYTGRSKKEIAASVGVDRATVAKYVAPAEAEGLLPGGPVVGEETWPLTFDDLASADRVMEAVFERMDLSSPF